jgi:predicted RNA binding protein YcfA (HicA-like mRNA interferase family)
MPKLRVLSGRGVCKILAQNGFEKVRQKGSHIIMQKQQGHTTITQLPFLCLTMTN